MKALTALTAALLATGGLPLATADAQAQAPRSLNLSREERDAIAALQVAVNGMDRAAQDAALATARARAQSMSARYAVAHFQFEIGRQRRILRGAVHAGRRCLQRGDGVALVAAEVQRARRLRLRVRRGEGVPARGQQGGCQGRQSFHREASCHKCRAWRIRA